MRRDIWPKFLRAPPGRKSVLRESPAPWPPIATDVNYSRKEWPQIGNRFLFCHLKCAELYDRLLEGKRLTAQLKEVHTCGPITVWRTLNGRIVVIAKTSAPIAHEGSNHQ